MLMILEIIQAIENDDERAKVEQIFHQHYKHMMAKSMSILNNYHDAQDAVQETFRCISENVKAFMNLDSDETAALVSVYTRNVAINMYNRNKRQQELFDMGGEAENRQAYGDSEQGNPQALIVNDEIIAIVRNGINQLDDKYRDVIILKYYYHMKNVEIAEVLKIEPGTVNTHVARAKKKLREILGEEGYERITY